MSPDITIGLVFAAVTAFVLIRSIRILSQVERGVVLTLGRYTSTREPGVTLIFPFLQQLIPVDVRVAVMEVPPQDVISRDNVAVKVTAVVYYRVTDPQKA